MPSRRRGREAEGGGLLNRYTVKSRIEGSNPSVSANYCVSYLILLTNYINQECRPYIYPCPEADPSEVIGMRLGASLAVHMDDHRREP